MASWSDIPTEITHEIAEHNADDPSTLHAMSLVSQATRLSVIKHIFSTINFQSVEAFRQWLDMLGRTPMLATVVKKVKFTNCKERDWRQRGLTRSDTPLRTYDAPPMIPSLPTVCSVEWCITLHDDSRIVMLLAHLALFPNVTKLHLGDTSFTFCGLNKILRACGQLKSLSFRAATLAEGDWFRSEVVRRIPVVLPRTRGLDGSRPVRLKLLVVADFLYEQCYPLQGIEQLLQFAAPSLTDLVLESKFPYTANQVLPAFPALESLTLWIRSYWGRMDHVIGALDAFTVAPRLTRLIFRLVLSHDGEEGVQGDFDDILGGLPRWRTSGSLKAVLARKAPRCESASSFIWTGWRRTGAGIEALVRIEWVDEQYNPVSYSANGKPPWKFQRPSYYAARRGEPETESSDCESEDSESDDDDSEEYDSDGNVVIREWTEAHERAYRREMLADSHCDNSSDEDDECYY
ncbi:hypothetical protein MVEN_01447300 [Mycena venus]|uniref:Uncharacterized protein n=1 Tax=Mycena venus TaxID=2733690 RepID=A0A8H6XUH2_9AGAR|nr:hypothetical protein MVEN_01447300 [Mycena venus]